MAAQVVALHKQPPNETSSDFPINALPSEIREAVSALAYKFAVMEEMAFQSVMSVISATVQGHADVNLPFGHACPTSLFFITIGGSGERKTTLDNTASKPMRQREEELSDTHKKMKKRHQFETRQYAKKLRALEIEYEDADYDEYLMAEQQLPKPSPEPREPEILMGHATSAGFADTLAKGMPSRFLSTGEGATFVKSGGMSGGERSSFTADISTAWDGDPLKKNKGNNKSISVKNYRLAGHLMGQPCVMASFLKDEAVRDQGLLARFWVSAPESQIGNRPFRLASEDQEQAIRAYQDKVSSLLRVPLPLRDDHSYELAPRVLKLSEKATELWIDVYNEVDRLSKKGERYAVIKDVAAKGVENAARCGACLELFGDINAMEVSVENLQTAIELMYFYLNTALEIYAGFDPKVIDEKEVLDKIMGFDGEFTSVNHLQQKGPSRFRKKNAILKEFVAKFVEQGHLEPAGRQIVDGNPSGQAYRIIR